MTLKSVVTLTRVVTVTSVVTLLSVVTSTSIVIVEGVVAFSSSTVKLSENDELQAVKAVRLASF